MDCERNAPDNSYRESLLCGRAVEGVSGWDRWAHLQSHEWFVAPLPVINQAIQMIQTGDIVSAVYDPEKQKLVER